MLMRKKMKTKFDYQARTFGACVILLLSFTLMFITPALEKVKEDNTTIMETIEKLEEQKVGEKDSEAIPANVGISITKD